MKIITKRVMSIAAATALLTTGAMAFDTKADGKIYTFPSGTASSITSDVGAAGAAEAAGAISHTGTQGDALIYPLFVQNDDYSTEIVVRNNSENAVVAKAVLYAGKDSRELLDFNIYLSGKDVCRFTLKGNSIYSEDGSLKIDGTKPIQITPALTDYDKLKFASASEPFSFNFANSTVPEAEYQHGYIAIMGMVELEPRVGIDTTTVPGSSNPIAFHKDHASIYAAYAQLLDDSRGDWRDIENINVLKESVFIDKVTKSPNVDLSALVPTNSVTWNKGTATQTTKLTDVQNDSLSGTVRLTNTTAKTDVLLNATAIQDFTEDNKALLWVEREYASIADRCLNNNGAYDEACVVNDANTFKVTTATYNYENKSNAGIVDNKVYITQPYKRILIQLNNGTGGTTGYLGTSVSTGGILTGEDAYFTTTASVFDEAEGFPAAPVTTTGTTGLNLSGTANTAEPVVDPTKYDKEVQMIDSTAFDKNEDLVDTYGEKDGFAEFAVGTPAIITQMVATKSGDAFVTNWVYSNTK